MTVSSFRPSLFLSFLLGGAAPFGILFFMPFIPLNLLFLLFFELVFGWVCSLSLARSYRPPPYAKESRSSQPAPQDALTPTDDLSEKVAHLSDLAEQHQNKASVSTSAAARATESATVIASAIEEMNTSISEIGRQADETSRMASSAVEKTKTADVSVGSLSSRSDEILSIVELIQTIAKHTNLLALNATIEAARAGEHGRGFAVVAGEVKALARQTAEATTKIETQINNVREASREVQTHVKDIESAILSIDKTAQTIKTALGEETQAAHEIAKSAQETTTATTAVTEGISHMLVTTEEIRRAIVDLGGKNAAAS